ncbi:transcriptional regulatory protein GAL4 [Microdochium nivale]|nr:transcriptional regulatory protein GAL4 [Microdochium nivale]
MDPAPEPHPGIRPLRLLLPASAIHGSSRPGAPAAPVVLPGPTAIAKGACEACRRRKVKCDGALPVCARCGRGRKACRYVEHLQPKVMKRKLDNTEDELQSHRELFRLIRSRPEADSLEIVRRIREGHDVHSLLLHVRDGDLLVQMAVAPDSWCRHSFPLAKEMPESLRQHGKPYLDSLLYRCAMDQEPSQPAATGSRRGLWAVHES